MYCVCECYCQILTITPLIFYSECGLDKKPTAGFCGVPHSREANGYIVRIEVPFV